MTLPISPNSTGLFNHIISESGTGFNSGGFSNTSVATTKSYDIASLAGCSRNSTNSSSSSFLSCLRAANASVLVEAFTNASWSGISVIEGLVLPLYPSIALSQGKFMNVSVIQGNNLPDNWPACPFLPTMNSTVAVFYALSNLPLWGLDPVNAPTVVAAYNLTNCSADPSSPLRCCQLLTDMFLDFMMVCNARRVFKGAYSVLNQRKLYWYRFNCDPNCPPGPGICQHTSEIAYVFGTESSYTADYPDGIGCSWNSTVRAFSTQVVNNWVALSTTGTPFDDQWISYTPPGSSLSSYYQLTPYQPFQSYSFMDDSKCDMFDTFEAENIAQMFPNEQP